MSDMPPIDSQSVRVLQLQNRSSHVAPSLSTSAPLQSTCLHDHQYHDLF